MHYRKIGFASLVILLNLGVAQASESELENLANLNPTTPLRFLAEDFVKDDGKFELSPLTSSSIQDSQGNEPKQDKRDTVKEGALSSSLVQQDKNESEVNRADTQGNTSNTRSHSKDDDEEPQEGNGTDSKVIETNEEQIEEDGVVFTNPIYKISAQDAESDDENSSSSNYASSENEEEDSEYSENESSQESSQDESDSDSSFDESDHKNITLAWAKKVLVENKGFIGLSLGYGFGFCADTPFDKLVGFITRLLSAHEMLEEAPTTSLTQLNTKGKLLLTFLGLDIVPVVLSSLPGGEYVATGAYIVQGISYTTLLSIIGLEAFNKYQEMTGIKQKVD